MMKEQKFSFDSDNDDLEERPMSEGIRLNSDRSRFARKAKVKQEFEQQAQETHANYEGYLKEGYELGNKFIKLVVDTTLIENKGPMSKSIEKEIISELVSWAIAANNEIDVKKVSKDGMGSCSVIALLLNAILKIRDNYNSVQYKCFKLEEDLLKLSSEVEKLHEKE